MTTKDLSLNATRSIGEEASILSSRDRDEYRNHETSPLLANNSHDGKPNSNDNVHYKNIDGKRFWLLFTCILIAYVLVYFDSFFMASSHPIITSSFHASNAASWLSTVFFLTSTIIGPFYGRISDVTGRRTMFIAALVMFAITTAWCGAARSIGEFVTARAFCGLGAGGVAVMSNIILSDIVKIQYRGIYQSYLNLCFGLGNGLGASLGGLLAEQLGWRVAFYLQVPLILMLTVLAAIATPSCLGPSLAKAENKTVLQALSSFDFAGALSLTFTVTGLVLGINLGGNVLSWTHPFVVASLVVCLLAAIVLFFAERKAIRPLLPLRLLSTIPYGNLNWSNGLAIMMSATVNFNMPLFLQAVRQTSPTKSGLVLLSPLVGMTVTSFIVGFTISKTRKLKPPMNMGALSMLGGMIACGCLNEHIPVAAVVFVIPWINIGQGLFFPPTTVSILSMTPADEQAVVVTTLGLCRSLGNILGVAVSSGILQNALVLFLDREVSGSPLVKEDIVKKVRKSIRSIADLEPVHRGEGKHVQVLFPDRTTLTAGSDQSLCNLATCDLPQLCNLRRHFVPLDSPCGYT